MKVRCEMNVDPGIPGSTIRSRFDLTVGGEYLVLGQCLNRGTYHAPSLELYFLVQANDDAPHWVPERMFTVTDPCLPARWEFRSDRAGDILAIWGYHRLVFSSEHFEGILEADPEELYFFRKEAELARLDFFSDEVQQSATDVGLGWVQCPQCTEAWENGSMQPLLQCPACRRILNNPRWL